jgi:hypothetical protein
LEVLYAIFSRSRGASRSHSVSVTSLAHLFLTTLTTSASYKRRVHPKSTERQNITDRITHVTMANPRTVINPFTKNEQCMRRNTESTKWVTAGASAVRKRGVDLETQIPWCTRKETFLPGDFEDGSSGTPAPLSMKDETKPLRSRLSAVRSNVSHRDSPVSTLTLVDFSRLEQSWKDFDTTAIPHCPATIEKPESKTERTWQRQDLDEGSDTNQATTPKQIHVQQQAVHSSTPWYRTAKHIYNAGPKGEGQKMWEAYQQAIIPRQADNKPPQDTSFEPMVEERTEKKPPTPLPTSPDGVLFPPLRLRPSPTQRVERGKEPDRPYLRRDSCFSSSSYEVATAVDRTVVSTIDANKPLPPVPLLDAAPKVQQTKSTPPGNCRQHAEREETHPWWKHSPSRAPQSLKSKISHPGPLTVSNKGTTVNVAAECGGVGGPAAAISLPVSRTGAPLPRPPSIHVKKKEAGRSSPRAFHLPTFHRSPSKSKGNAYEKVEVYESEDTHPPHWRDRLVGPAYEAGKSLKQTAMETLDGVHVGRKRRTSDASFACQGIVDSKLDRYQVSEPSSSDDEKGMVPDPLFYVKRTETDTRFH